MLVGVRVVQSQPSFGTSWLGILGMEILSTLIFAITSVILGALFGLAVPASVFPHL
jgi:hypothetical protein